jgi:pimeloyl-ACP methyl ester carboxylesterase
MGKRRIVTAKGPRAGMLTSRVVMRRELQEGRLRMAYFEAGVGAPLLMLHGLGGSSRWWFPLFPELSSASLRLIVPDLPGFGRSPGPMLEIADASRAVIRLVDRMGLAQFFLCGHSMGGAIAAQIAADYGGRVRRLVLIDSAGIPGTGPNRALGRVLQPWSWCPLRFYPTFVGDMLRAGPRNMLNGIHEMRHFDIQPMLRRVRVKTLVIWGEKDFLTPLEQGRKIADGLPDAQLEIVPGARHLPMVSAPDIVSRLIVRFFGEEL